MLHMLRAFRCLPVYGGLWLVLALGGVGCADTAAIEDLRAGGRTFHDYLYTGYRDLALYEARDMYDRADGEYFALKAREAFGGGYVEPTLLAERRLSAPARQDLESARADLMQLLQGMMGMPEAWEGLARAQTSFDCWVEEQEEGHQPAHIDSCRHAFETAMAGLGRLRTSAEPAPR